MTHKRDVGLLRASSAGRGAGENAFEVHKSDFSGNETALETAHASAGESKGIIELHEVKESVLLKSATTTTAGDLPRILPSVQLLQVVIGLRMRLQVRVMKS